MIYERTDRIGVASRRMLADILKHRKKQISQKKRFTDMESELDKLCTLICGRWPVRQARGGGLGGTQGEGARNRCVQTQQLEEYKDRYIQQLIAEREEENVLRRSA